MRRVVAAGLAVVLAGCSRGTTEGLQTYTLDRDSPTTMTLLGAVVPAGVIDVRSTCVVLDDGADGVTLAFPSGSTRTQDTVRVRSVVGDDVVVADGDEVALVGGGSDDEPGGPLPAAPEGCPTIVRRVIDIEVFD